MVTPTERLRTQQEALQRGITVEQIRREQAILQPQPTPIVEVLIQEKVNEVQLAIKDTQSELNQVQAQVKRLQERAQFISNVEKKKVGSALRQEIIRTGERADELKQRISILKSSRTVAEATQRQQFAQAAIISQVSTREQRRQALERGDTIIDRFEQGVPVFVTLDPSGKKVFTKETPFVIGGSKIVFGRERAEIEAAGPRIIQQDVAPEFQDVFITGTFEEVPVKSLVTKVIEAPRKAFEKITGRTPGEAAVFVTGGDPSKLIEGEAGAELISRGKGIIGVGGQIIGFPITIATEIGKAGEQLKIEEAITGEPQFFPIPEFGTQMDFGEGLVEITPLVTDIASIDVQITKSKKRQDIIKGQKSFFGADVEAIAREENIRLELELKKSAINIEKQLQDKFDKRIVNFRNDIQNKINNGKVSFSNGQSQLDDFISNQNEKFGREFTSFLDKIITTKQTAANDRLDNLSKRAGLKIAIVTLPVTIVTGFGLGTLAGISRAAAIGIGGIGIGTIAIEAPQVAAATSKGDLIPLETTAIQFAGFGVGGVFGARFGAKIKGKNIEAETIIASIDRSTTRSNVIGKNLNILKIVKFPKGFENEIKNLIDQGFSVNLIQTKLFARTTADAKIIPDVRGLFIEITARDGTLINRIGLGSVVSKQKGKTFTRNIISVGEGKISRGTLDILTRTTIFEVSRKGLKKVDEVKTLEEITIREEIKKPEEFKIETIADIDIGLVKPEILSLELPSILKKAKRVAKPQAKAEVFLEEILTDISLEVTPISRPVTKGIEVKFADIITGKTLGDVRGVAISEPIVSIKLTKAEVRGAKRQEIKERRIEVKRQKEIEEFNKRIDEVSALEILTPRQLKVAQEQLVKIVSIPEVLVKGIAKAIEVQKAKVVPKVKQIIVQAPDITQVQDIVLTKQQKQINKQLQKVSETLTEKQFLELSPSQKQFQKQLQKLTQVIDQSQLQKQFQKQLQPSRFDFTIKPTPIKVKKPVILDFDFPEDPIIEKIRKSNKPHDVFVKTKGKRKQIADNIPGNIAIDMGAFITDMSLGAEFGIRETKGKIEEAPFNPPQGYWGLNKHKFRGFKIQKGKKIPIKNIWIERKNRRLDTAGEIGGITTARLLAQQQRKNIQMQKINKSFQNLFGFPQQKTPKKRRKKK